jgi:hypothetical protein
VASATSFAERSLSFSAKAPSRHPAL